MLTSLSAFSPFLKEVECSNNQIATFPTLNDNLKILLCDNNHLTSLPIIPPNLNRLKYNRNPIYDIIGSDDLSVIREHTRVLQRFRELYYSLKYKIPLRKWLWVQIREPKIIRYYHPSHLEERLESADESIELDQILINW
jgi:Leucine-rich repeat (LRR) protein